MLTKKRYQQLFTCITVLEGLKKDPDHADIKGSIERIQFICQLEMIAAMDKAQMDKFLTEREA